MKFSDFIIEILNFSYSHSERFELEIPEEKFDLYKVEFRGLIKKIYLKIQKFLEE